MSPRPPPKSSYKDSWINELDSEVAGSSKDNQRIQPKQKPNYQERRDPNVDQNPPKVACLHLQGLGRSNKNGETREGGGARH